MLRIPLLLATLTTAIAATACGDDGDDTGGAPAGSEAVAVRERLTTIDDAVVVWQQADTIGDAHAAAETAANLVVGPNGPDFGDRDGDGTIGGDTDVGLLPGTDGTPDGLANQLADNECVAVDVLGGDWDDPEAQWATMETAIDRWRPDANTMPNLPSHPMRIVGWATFTLDTDSLDDAHEYAGHAELHVDVSLDALDC